MAARLTCLALAFGAVVFGGRLMKLAALFSIPALLLTGNLLCAEESVRWSKVGEWDTECCGSSGVLPPFPCSLRKG